MQKMIEKKNRINVMEVKMQQLKPKDIFFVSCQNFLNEPLHDALVACYLPIIGAKAFSLYQFFVYQEKILDAGPHTHGEAFNYLNLGLTDFLEARQKLEAIGLLATFWHEKNGYVYEVNKPLTTQEFLKDDIFTQLLLDRIGQEAVSDLVSLRQKNLFDKKDYQDITSNFKTKFSLPLETLHSNQEITQKNS